MIYNSKCKEEVMNMEDKILKELREIKELLHDIKENMEQKEIKTDINYLLDKFSESSKSFNLLNTDSNEL